MKQNAIQISMINNSNNSNQRLKEIRLLACDEEGRAFIKGMIY